MLKHYLIATKCKCGCFEDIEHGCEGEIDLDKCPVCKEDLKILNVEEKE